MSRNLGIGILGSRATCSDPTVATLFRDCGEWGRDQRDDKDNRPAEASGGVSCRPWQRVSLSEYWETPGRL